jgi:hypothetical protein
MQQIATQSRQLRHCSSVIPPTTGSVAHFRSTVVLAAALALCGVHRGLAQAPALDALTKTQVDVRYAANESGGRITITRSPGDTSSIETMRLQLIEMAAAIRRGDFKKVRIIQVNHPAVTVLAARKGRIRCTFRPTANGGELLLLSDDDQVVKAIQQLLAAEPPPSHS